MLRHETNRYYLQLREQYDRSYKAVKWMEVTSAEERKFFAIIFLFGHTRRDNLKEYWSTDPILQPILIKDRGDQYLAYYSFSRKTVKWTKNVALWLINCAIFTSFLVFKNLNPHSKFSISAECGKSLGYRPHGGGRIGGRHRLSVTRSINPSVTGAFKSFLHSNAGGYLNNLIGECST
ncbi:hypothetical protein B7P43_G15740 [Cryptotermes secundus]|uniref:PiggyBac transposable element-derived protein domain-containing protein n=1 Tax=Cryptotermes secundus TaxID=105785 RepID=A0A2J7PRG9_9NEOP|nr:hypothetical protein B7P43_G15740 [Cryptotermes secundus]